MKITLPEEISEDLAEETGWHIGDGSMNYYKNGGKPKGIYQLRGHIEDDREHYFARIKPIFKSLYGLDVSLREMPSTRVFGFQIWNNDIVAFKHKLGLPLGKKFELEIPKAFLADKKYILACIRGIFDTDGCLYLEKKNGKLYPRMQISTISIKLADQLVSVLNSFGFRATKQIDDSIKEGNRLVSYIVTIRGVEMLHKFFSEIKPQNLKHLEKYKRFVESAKALKTDIC
jgi:intein/homing endonuclease